VPSRGKWDVFQQTASVKTEVKLKLRWLATERRWTPTPHFTAQNLRYTVPRSCLSAQGALKVWWHDAS
jgi:hypothetical protein